MTRPTPARVGSSSPRPKRTKTIHNPWIRRTSQPAPPGRKTRTPTKRRTEEVYWRLDDPPYLAERIVNGKTEFLVNWADDERTGEKYDSTWEPLEHLLEADQAAWQRKKEQGLVRDVVVDGYHQNVLQEVSGSVALSHEYRSRSPTISQQYNASGSSPRVNISGSATVQSNSKRKRATRGIEPEVKDSYEEDHILSTPASPRIRVEISFPAGLDRDAYAIVNSSQPSQNPHSTDFTLSSQFEADSQSQVLTLEPFRQRVPRNRFIVPDSQDCVDTGSYQPSDTNISTLSSKASTGLSAQIDNETVDINSSQRITSSRSETFQSGLAEPFDPPTNLHYQDPDSIDTIESDEALSMTHQVERSELSTSPSPSTNANGSSEKSLGQIATVGSSSNREYSSSSHSRLVSSQLISPPRERETLSEEADLLSAQPSPPPASSFEEQSGHASQSAEVIAPQSGPEGEHSSRHSSRSEPAQLSTHHLSGTRQPSQITTSDQSVPDFLTALESQQQVSIKDFAASEHNIVPIQTPTAASIQTRSDTLPSPTSSESPSPHLSSDNSLPSVEASVEFTSQTQSLRRPPPASTSLDDGETSDDNALSRPSTVSVSGSDMDDQAQYDATKAFGLKMIKEAKARGEAKLAAARDAESASSSIPPSAVHHVSGQPIPLRELPTEAPVFAPLETESSAEVSTETEDFNSNIQIMPSGRNEFFVPLPMNAATRDIYTETIKSHKYQRYTFVTEEVHDPVVVKEIDEMLLGLDLLCSHSDLIADDFSTQRLESDATQAKFAENQSTKCIFTAELLEAMRHSDQHIVILVRPGRMMEILEALLRYHDFTRRAEDRAEYSCDPDNGALKVTLLSTGPGENNFAVAPASLVVAFDSTFSHEPYIKDLRTNSHDPQNLSPLIFLLITHSIEHVELYFDKDTKDNETKVRLVSTISKIAGEVGKLSPSYHPPQEAAEEVSRFVIDKRADPETWAIRAMPEIEEIEIDLAAEPESRESEEATLIQQQSAVTSAASPRLNLKRTLVEDDVMTIDSPKRLRLTPVPGEETNNASVNLDGEEAPQSTTSIIESTDLGLAAGTNVADQDEVKSLLERISSLEVQLREKGASESSYRRLNSDLESRLRDMESSMAEIQPKYQEALNERGQFEHEGQEALARANLLKQKLDTRVEELTKLKAQKGAVDTELTTIRTMLVNSTVPEVAELEGLKVENRALIAEKERLQKRITNMSNDLEYMRNNYQTASSSAAEAATELRSAQAEIEVLRVKASENRVRIHEIQNSNEVAIYLNKIAELKAENESLDKELEKKCAELGAVLNGRRATRGTSVPRSPRMGQGTMSPGPARTIGRVLHMGGVGSVGGGSRSRGNSPAPGEFGNGAGKPSGLFGDPLYPQAQATSRFGSHLQ